MVGPSQPCRRAFQAASKAEFTQHRVALLAANSRSVEGHLNHGRITLAGLRTPQMAAQIQAIGAINQTGDEVEQLLLNEHTQRSARGN